MGDAVREQLEKVIDEKIRPYLKSHDGDMVITSVTSPSVSVKLLGQCNNCPGALAENRDFFSKVICEEVPEINEVIIETGVSDGLLEEAIELLRSRRDSR